MKRILGFVCAFIVCGLALCDDWDRSRAKTVLAFAEAQELLETPSTPVDGKCADCYGTGKRGDGRTVFTCPTCKGTGKTPAIASAEPGAVRLLVSLAPFSCPPCYQLKRAVDAGEFDGFAVEYSDDWKPRQYPAIRYPLASSPTGWSVMYGYDNTTVPRLRQATNPILAKQKLVVTVLPDRPAFMPTGTKKQDLVAEHNRLHGGGNWTWPGDLATHLRDTHGVNLTSSGVSINRGSSCPGGVCPTSSRTGRRR